MTSAIDVTKPETGDPTTQSVRDNFTAAKSEIEALQAAVGAGGGPYLALAGGTMVGAIVLPGDPTAPLQAATRQYVDAHAGTGGGGIPEAPNDSSVYGRHALAWQALTFAVLGGSASYAQLPAALRQVPVPFVFSGKPSAGALVNVPVAMAMTIAGGLAGTTAFRTTAPASNAVFVLNKISGGVTTQLGQVILVPGTTQMPSLSGPGGALVVGDALQMVAPSTQDTALADVGITILASRT